MAFLLVALKQSTAIASRITRSRGAYDPNSAPNSQTRTVLSSLADTICRPSGLNAAEVTVLVCPVIVCSQSPVAALQTRTVSSLLADTIF
jgi:hypothetical protein